jgi:T3SS negative regulator,GrlR
MLNGIYSVAFSSAAGQLGTGGVVAFIDGRAYGGDAGYYYKGTMNIDGQTATGQIHVAPHNERTESIFGPLTEFDLQLSGNVTEDSFSLGGDVIGHPGMAIKVNGRKVSDL